MKIRSDILSLYRHVHSWVGIVCGIFLFAAFYAGSITLFEEPLAQWLLPLPPKTSSVPLNTIPLLMSRVEREYPHSKGHLGVFLDKNHWDYARLEWRPVAGGHHGSKKVFLLVHQRQIMFY